MQRQGVWGNKWYHDWLYSLLWNLFSVAEWRISSYSSFQTLLSLYFFQKACRKMDQFLIKTRLMARVCFTCFTTLSPVRVCHRLDYQPLFGRRGARAPRRSRGGTRADTRERWKSSLSLPLMSNVICFYSEHLEGVMLGCFTFWNVKVSGSVLFPQRLKLLWCTVIREAFLATPPFFPRF